LLKQPVFFTECKVFETQTTAVVDEELCLDVPFPSLDMPVEAAGGKETSSRIRRPSWVPDRIVELDGLRGVAILWVILYHCHDKLSGTPLFSIAQWGWAGVNLFFVLSGFLITGILLDSRTKSTSTRQFFRDFYARRILRIWPVYVLVLFLVYIGVPLLFGTSWLPQVKAAPWLRYALFVQNLFMMPLPGTLGPTWSLAIEEQYYLIWAPLARWLHPRSLLLLLSGVILASPLLRMDLSGMVSRTHTLIHLDGIALGSLVAVVLHTVPLTQTAWRKISQSIIVAGIAGLYLASNRFPVALDSAFALFFAGVLLAAVSFSGTAGFYTSIWKLRGLAFYGRISYGLYMVHILVFVVLGNLDRFLEPYGIRGNLAIVLIRLVLSTTFATLLWYSFEKPILRWKRYFSG
jgi:peptidoglycan/LPS O-acetylase OafA/YrhL